MDESKVVLTSQKGASNYKVRLTSYGTTLIRTAPQVRQAIDKFIAAYNPQAAPLEWHKRTVTSSDLKHHYADLCNWVLANPPDGCRG